MSPAPKVSILLPTLNSRKYLEKRMKSIREQTITGWELVVVDSYSNDGSWEYFAECAQKDPRIMIYQSKERGIYNNFNKCIQLARGEYVYFATSDDTMAPNALEEMTKALDENPGCDLAHCKLRIIDEHDNISDQKIWDNFYIVTYFGELINKKHIRKAPHDGVLHFCGITVYTSLTQLLIRRRLFERIGMFLTDYGPIADFEWEMRATLAANTVHVPEYLATWRLHSNQATGEDTSNQAKASGKFLKMAGHAVKIARKLNPAIKAFNMKELKYLLEKEKLYFEIKSKKTGLIKWLIVFKWLFINYKLIIEMHHALKKKRNFISQKDFLNYTKKLINKYELGKNLVKIE